MTLTSADQLGTATSSSSSLVGGTWEGGGVTDSTFKRLVVVFNCTPLTQDVMWQDPSYPSVAATSVEPANLPSMLELHPLQAAFDHDARAGGASKCPTSNAQEGGVEGAGGGLVSILLLRVPARTTAVFVDKRIRSPIRL
jgi:hypothetical protein